MWGHHHGIQHQCSDGDDGDNAHRFEGLAGTCQVDNHNRDVAEEINGPTCGNARDVEGFDITANEGRDGCGGQYVLQQNGDRRHETGEITHRYLRKQVATARRGESGRQLRESQAHAHVQHRNDEESTEKATPAAGTEPELPAGEVPRNDERYAQSSQDNPVEGTLFQMG